MTRRLVFGLTFVGSLFIAATASAQLMSKQTLTLATAKQVAVAAEAEAVKNNWKVVVAIVDDGGHLLYLQRMDEVQIGSIDIAIGKANTSVRLKRPTKAVEDVIAGGRTAFLSVPHLMALEGGIPIVVDGKVLGAVGVSGVTSQQDAQIAKAGLDAFMKLIGR